MECVIVTEGRLFQFEKHQNYGKNRYRVAPPVCAADTIIQLVIVTSSALPWYIEILYCPEIDGVATLEVSPLFEETIFRADLLLYGWYSLFGKHSKK